MSDPKFRFYIDKTVWHGSRYWKMEELAAHEVVGWNTRYVAYTVRKITAKQIVVEHGTTRIVLKREVMERMGKQYHSRFHEYFYAEKPPREQPRSYTYTPGLDLTCINMLGLSWPCSKADVRRAYKRLALTMHPDRGGSHGAFIQLKTAHDQALRLAS